MTEFVFAKRVADSNNKKISPAFKKTTVANRSF